MNPFSTEEWRSLIFCDVQVELVALAFVLHRNSENPKHCMGLSVYVERGCAVGVKVPVVKCLLYSESGMIDTPAPVSSSIGMGTLVTNGVRMIGLDACFFTTLTGYSSGSSS